MHRSPRWSRLVPPLLCAILSITPYAVRAQEVAQDLQERMLGSRRPHAPRVARAQARAGWRAGPAAIAGPGDTTWIGHSPSGTYSYGPYHVGAGPNRPGSGDPNGLWDWDHFAAGESDSLQGWWPIRRLYSITGGLTMPDTDRPWWAVETGNLGNYVLESQHQNRTFGVLSYWHVDDGNAHPGPANAIAWAPIAGSASVWCGLRAAGDLAFVDPLTGNPYNQTVLDFQGENGGGTGTFKHFPGYTSQMDQILYRDVELTSPSATLNLSFAYRTAMSTQTGTASATRTGWFVYDPTTIGAIAVTGPNAGAPNFVSNTGTGTPADSFLVYLGVPVNLDAVYTADGTLHAPDAKHPHGVYDPYRRWLSEVIALDQPLEKVLAVGGNASTTFTLAGKDLSAYYAAQSGAHRYLRIVFRVHTNRGFDDSGGGILGGYNSGGQGAVLLDEVSVGGSGLSGGAFGTSHFESPGEIDNGLAATGFALGAWCATGKPPATYAHAHPINGGDIGGGNVYDPLVWQDVCGPPGSPSRLCNMNGVVISMGTHDDHERTAGGLNAPPGDHEAMYGIMSPTINLCSSGPGDFNAEGIDGTINQIADDVYLTYDVYTGAMNPFVNGVEWIIGAQSYPSVETNGPAVRCWGELRIPGAQFFNGTPACVQDLDGLYGFGLIKTSNASGVPDSLRVFLGLSQQCFRFGVTSANCNTDKGAYFDNVSLGISNALAPGGGGGPFLAVDPWYWLHDAFPANATAGLPGTPAFDTCAAIVQTGLNAAPSTGDANRPDVAADSAVVYVDGGVPERVDMIFRIKPGPGNYHAIGNRASGLRPVPTDAVNIVFSGDGSFWGQYMGNPGAFASPGAAAQHAAAPSGWSENVWNSARCDTASSGGWRNLTTGSFLDTVSAVGLPAMAATYEESDPHFATLGVSRHICFQVNPGLPPTTSNLVCDGTLPSWVTAGAGYDAAAYNPPNQAAGCNNCTREGTKIIPDGLLTPGSHVEYFFALRPLSNPSAVTMAPDTHFVSPQLAALNGRPDLDGHRWQEFSVLPDRWKNSAFGGAGLACMLVVDVADGGGDERAWVSIADSICLTSADRRGAHNGWRARGDQLYTDAQGNPIDVSGDPSIAVYTHGGCPGTVWDMYGVRGGGSAAGATLSGHLGSRYSVPATGLAAGRDARMGPTLEMLDRCYPTLVMLSGGLNASVLGPFIGCSANDVQLLESWLSGATPRALYIAGDGFVESEYKSGLNFPAHQTLLQNYLGVTIGTIGGNPNYAYGTASGDFRAYVELKTSASPGNTFAVGNSCLWGNDVLAIPIAGPTVWSTYGSGVPYIAGVRYQPAGQHYLSIVEGYDIQHLLSPYGGNTHGRLVDFLGLASELAAASGCGTPACLYPGLGGVAAGALRDWFGLYGTPLRGGWATVHLGLTRPDRVQVRIYDVAGRQVRLLANRVFPAGEHELRWDGTGDSGERLAHGIYFARASYASSGFTDAKRIVVLR